MDKEQQKLLYYSLDENITIGQLKKLQDFTFDTEKANQLSDWMEKRGVVGITQEMRHYPQKFLQVKSVPYLFYAMGNIELLQKNILGIVGPRMMSLYAKNILEKFFEELEMTTVVTVSGLARGVDQMCHQLSLKHHIPTIAVLGGGLRTYLQKNDKKLIHEIVESGGLVLSEFKLDFVPTTWSFPQRNRLIAGLSDVLFLPEARKGSGSLITVDFALKMQKEVFVAPNQLFSANGIGSNQLLSQGKVKLLSDFVQLSERFGKDEKFVSSSTSSSLLTSQEKLLIDFVSKYAYQDLSAWMGEVPIDFSELLSQLTALEIKGLIAQSSPGLYFVK